MFNAGGRLYQNKLFLAKLHNERSVNQSTGRKNLFFGKPTNPTTMKKKLFSFVLDLDKYLPQREKFFAEHPNCKVIEELKTLNVGMIQPEDFKGRLSGIQIPNMQPQIIITMAWVIWIEEPEIQKII
jgi:hypothetical protein